LSCNSLSYFENILIHDNTIQKKNTDKILAQ